MSLRIVWWLWLSAWLSPENLLTSWKDICGTCGKSRNPTLLDKAGMRRGAGIWVKCATGSSGLPWKDAPCPFPSLYLIPFQKFSLFPFAFPSDFQYLGWLVGFLIFYPDKHQTGGDLLPQPPKCWAYRHELPCLDKYHLYLYIMHPALTKVSL